MQVKPRFKDFKILKRFPIGVKDDRGDDFDLIYIQATPKTQYDDEYIEQLFFWTVVSNNSTNWNNGANSFSSYSFYKDKKEVLLKLKLEGFLIEEVFLGKAGNVFNSSMFSDGDSYKYKYKITKID